MINLFKVLTSIEEMKRDLYDCAFMNRVTVSFRIFMIVAELFKKYVLINK